MPRFEFQFQFGSSFFLYFRVSRFRFRFHFRFQCKDSLKFIYFYCFRSFRRQFMGQRNTKIFMLVGLERIKWRNLCIWPVGTLFYLFYIFIFSFSMKSAGAKAMRKGWEQEKIGENLRSTYTAFNESEERIIYFPFPRLSIQHSILFCTKF